MVRISCKKFVSKELVKRLLSVVPKEDLEGLRQIRFINSAHTSLRNRKRKTRRGLSSCYGYYDKKEITLIMWTLKDRTLRSFSIDDTNLYHNFVKNLAETMYHEIGHYVDDKSKLLNKFHNLRKRVEQSNYRWLYPMLSTCQFAEAYSKSTISEAESKGILDIVYLNEIRYFKVFQNKYINSILDMWTKNNKRFHWTTVAVFTHLRKNKLGNGKSVELLYTAPEILKERYSSEDRTFYKKNASKFLKTLLKTVNPVIYYSKNRKFYFFKASDLRKEDMAMFTPVNKKY